jgi:hypothetical protein
MAKEDEDEKKKEEVMAAEEAAAEAPAEEVATEEAPAEAPVEDGGEPGEEQTVGSSLRDDGSAPKFEPSAEGRRMVEELLAGSGPSEVQQIINDLADKINTERKDIKDLAEQAPKAPDLADLVVALLPVALGAAVGGKRGALAGGVGGLEGMVKSRDKRQERIAKEIESKEKYARTLEGRLTSLQGQVAVALENRVGTLPQGVLEQMAGYTTSAVTAQQTLDFLNKFFPDEESLGGYAKRLKDQYLGTKLNNAQILSNLRSNLRLAQQAGIKGVPSKEDQKLIDEVLAGGKITFVQIQNLRNALENSVRRLIMEANVTGESYRKFASGEKLTTEYVQDMAARSPVPGAEERKEEEPTKKGEPTSPTIGTITQELTANGTPQGFLVVPMRDDKLGQRIGKVPFSMPWVQKFLSDSRNMNAAKNFNNLSQREQVEYLQRLEKALADYAKTVQIQ